MTKQRQIVQTDYASVIKHANSVLRLSQIEIKAKFSDYPICLMEYIDKKQHENVVEIRFDDKNLTLSCSFDENSKCNASYLFFDNLDDIDDYVDHFNDVYDYSFFRGRWTLSDCFLSIQKTNDDFHLMLSI